MILSAPTQSRQPTFVLPRSFEPRQLGLSWSVLDDARFFVSLVLRKTAYGETDDGGYVRLMARLLDKVMDKRHRAKVVAALISNNIVRRTPYQVGRAAHGYALGDQFLADAHVRYSPINKSLVERLHRAYQVSEKTRLDTFLPVHFELAKRQQQLRVDEDQATSLLQRLPPESNPFDSQAILIGNIQQKEFRLSVGECGRVFNSICNLRRDLRRALRFGNEPLGGVDLSCCQPALLGWALKTEQEGKGGGRKKRGRAHAYTLYDFHIFPSCGGDLEIFRQLAFSGSLYSHLEGLMERAGHHMTREQVKRKFCVDVLAKARLGAGGGEYSSELENQFKIAFPTVYRAIRAINDDGFAHANLVRQLQALESRLVIHTVLADLLKRFPSVPFISIHDSVYSTPANVGRVQAAFGRAFEQFGISMRLKTVDA